MFQSATLSQEANIAYFVGILSCAALNYEYLKCIHTNIIIILKENYVCNVRKLLPWAVLCVH